MDKLNIEIHKCVLCHNAICNKKYKNIDPERIIRALRLNNIKGAYTLLQDKENLFELNDDVNNNCKLNVDINFILEELIKNKQDIGELDNIDLSSEICNIKIENPFILSSSVVGSKYDMCKRAFEKGWAGVVTKTISLMEIHESSPRVSALKDWDNSFIRI